MRLALCDHFHEPITFLLTEGIPWNCPLCAAMERLKKVEGIISDLQSFMIKKETNNTPSATIDFPRKTNSTKGD